MLQWRMCSAMFVERSLRADGEMLRRQSSRRVPMSARLLWQSVREVRKNRMHIRHRLSVGPHVLRPTLYQSVHGTAQRPVRFERYMFRQKSRGRVQMSGEFATGRPDHVL